MELEGCKVAECAASSCWEKGTPCGIKTVRSLDHVDALEVLALALDEAWVAFAGEGEKESSSKHAAAAALDASDASDALEDVLLLLLGSAINVASNVCARMRYACSKGKQLDSLNDTAKKEALLRCACGEKCARAAAAGTASTFHRIMAASHGRHMA